MKLRRVAIQSLPGIDRPFELEALPDGLNIISGPNGIGKSRLCAAIRVLLWPGSGEAADRLVARAAFEVENRVWQVSCDHAQLRWQREGMDAHAPPLPAEHLDACFFLGLRDLFDDQDRASRDLAAEIRRQMSGGFDLAAIAKQFAASVGPRIGQSERKAVEAAAKEILRARREQDGVEGRQQELASLEARAAEAERAAPRGAYFETAIALQELKAERAVCERERSELPEALAHVDGREVARLDKLDEEFAAKQRERTTADIALRKAKEAAQGTHLDAPLESAVVSTWRERVVQISDLERDLKQGRLDEIAAREAFARQRRALGSHAPLEADLQSVESVALDDDFDLFAFLRESQTWTRETEVARARLRLLADRTFPDEEARRLESLKRAVEPLRSWLRAPDPTLGADPGRASFSPRRAYLMGALFATAGLMSWLGANLIPVELRIVLSALGLIVIGVGLGFAAVGVFFGWLGPGHGEGHGHDSRRADETDWRAVAQSQFSDAVEPPEDWTTESVTRRLRELEDELSKLDSNEKRARDRAVERGALEENLRAMDRHGVSLAERRSALVERLGLDHLRDDAEIVDLVRALDAARSADAEARAAAARARELESRFQRALEEIVEFLGELVEARPNDGASARAAVDSLEERNRALVDAIAEENRQRQNCERLDVEIERLVADRTEIFSLAGVDPGDRPALEHRLAQLPRYRELTALRSRMAARIEQAESELESAGESTLAERSTTELLEERESAQRRAQERSDLEQQIAVIKNDAAQARAGHVLEEAIARKEAALSALQDRQDEALLSRAGLSLIDQVRSEYEKDQMPRVLTRARRHFSTFTHNRYALRVAPGEGGSFVAIDNDTGEGLRPDQLSDGTRAQLILAARLAFAEEAEQGADLPLFLDEAMDHSDPERFHAIARSLARMVLEEGRQIFYLTNDPTDIERFEVAFAEEQCDQLSAIDLAQVRGRAARVDRAAALRIPPLDVVPAPMGHEPEQYGVVLGVPILDPSQGSFSQHVFYLLRDDLLLLYELMQARIKSVGQCRDLLRSRSPVAKGIVDSSDVGASLDARIALLETFCLAWREGRGQVVGRAALEASEAVSQKYLDGFVEIVTELDGDGRALIAAIEERSDPRLRGFLHRSVERLGQFLIDQGYIDDRPILAESQIVDRAIGTPAAKQLSPKIAAELIHQWWTLSNHSKSEG